MMERIKAWWLGLDKDRQQALIMMSIGCLVLLMTLYPALVGWSMLPGTICSHGTPR